MSDIDKQIDRWRSALANSQAMTDSDIYELENHLRDEMGHLLASGLSDVEAFLIARHRLGDASSLEMEFAKIKACGQLGNRIRWMMLGVLLFLFATYFSSTVSLAFIWLGLEGGLGNATNLAIFGAFVRAAAAIATLLFALWLYARLWRPRTTKPISRWIMIFSTGVLVAGVMAFGVVQVFCTALVVRCVGPRDYGLIATASGYANMVWRVLIPILLIGWLAADHRRSSRRASTQQ
jgi:hypothetical protein